jgi:hypothetical protein
LKVEIEGDFGGDLVETEAEPGKLSIQEKRRRWQLTPGALEKVEVGTISRW